MTASEFVLVRRSDLEVALDGYSHAVRDRLRAALAADQTDDVARTMYASRRWEFAPGQYRSFEDAPHGYSEIMLDLARAVLGVRGD